MNKNRKMKRKVAASVAVGMSVMMGVTPAFAANGTSNSEVYKEETVYVNAKASGKTDKVTVSNWLKNSGSVSGDLEDESTLSDIKNVKGDAKLIAELSTDLGEAMVGINEQEIELLMAERGK